MKIKYTADLLLTMKLFSRITGAHLKDCFEFNNLLYFVVMPGQLGKAVGKGGSKVKELQDRFKKKVKIIEFSQDIKKFIKNVIHPLKVDDVREENGEIVLCSTDRKIKGQLIGRDAKSLNIVKSVISRYFTISQIRVE